MAGLIALDASVLIAHLRPHDVHHARAVAALRSAAGADLAASVISLAEVLVGPISIGRVGAAEDLLKGLEVREVPLPPDAARRLAALRASTGLKLPDCCVLLAAEDARADTVLTCDAKLAAAARAAGFAAAG